MVYFIGGGNTEGQLKNFSDDRHILHMKMNIQLQQGAVMIMIIWYLDLHLLMQSVLNDFEVTSLNSAHGYVYSTTYVTKFVSDLQFSLDTLVSSTNKTDHHHITKILLKVVLNTITLNPNPTTTLLYK